jgi:hypothetical protein
MTSSFQPLISSFPRKRESKGHKFRRLPWTPASAGVTMNNCKRAPQNGREDNA